MEKNIVIKNFIKSLNKEKIKDYLYPAIFFIIFSIFIVFAIKPSLTTVFELLKEEETLLEKNKQYERGIDFVSSNLYILESLRDKLYLLDSSIPNTPLVNKILEDIYKIGNDSNLTINRVNLIDKVEYPTQKILKIKTIGIEVESVGEFENLISLIEKMNAQRRMQTIKSIEVSNKNKTSTESSKLNIKIRFESYYL